MDWTFGGTWPYEPHWFPSPDGVIHYVDEGPRGGRPIVLLHGNPTWGYLFRRLIPSLNAAGHRVVVPDHLGFGRSAKPGGAGHYELARHVETTDKGFKQVLFSGQESIGPLIANADTWTLSALALLILFKGLAYGLSLGSFRGGPVFPAMFLGAAAGLMASHLPGFDLTPAVAVGLGAAVVSILRLPLAAVVLATLLTSGGGLGAGPVIIVGVVVAYIVTLALPGSGSESTPSEGDAAEDPGTGPAPGAELPARG